MTTHTWVLAASFADHASAQAAAARLAIACLPTEIAVAAPVAGLPLAYNVLVPGPLVGLAVDVLDPAAGALAAPRRPRVPARSRKLAHLIAASIVALMATGAVYWRSNGASLGHHAAVAAASTAHVQGRADDVPHTTLAGSAFSGQ